MHSVTQKYSHGFLQSIYSNVSHSGLRGDTDLMDRLQELVPARSRGLDAGCGAGARDVFFYRRKGYDIYGVDAIEENIKEERGLHPEIAQRVSVADLREPLSYPDCSFGFHPMQRGHPAHRSTYSLRSYPTGVCQASGSGGSSAAYVQDWERSRDGLR